MSADGLLQRALECYEEAVFGGEAGAIADGERGLDRVEADLALARARLLHARHLESGQVDERQLPLSERAAQLYQALGDDRGRAEALFWIGCFHQVVAGDTGTARPVLSQAAELAREADEALTLSYALRHLGLADLADGDRASARALLEESLELRRRLGYQPGVAASLVSLAQVARLGGDDTEAAALLDEAETLARESWSSGVLASIEAARARR